MTRKDELRASVEVTDSGCWIPKRRRHKKNHRPRWYRTVNIRGKTVFAHRVAWQLFRGPIPKGMHICHTCDNPPCCNPDHLFLGTSRENTQDRHKKGRDASGQRNGNAKLSDKDVMEIRQRYDGKYGRLSELAKEFSVSVDQVRNVVRGKQRMASVKEVSWVHQYDSHASRSPRPAEVRERIRQSLKGRKRPSEVVEKIRAARWGGITKI